MNFSDFLLQSLPFEESDEFEAPEPTDPRSRAKIAIQMLAERGVDNVSGLAEVAFDKSEQGFLRIEAICLLRILREKQYLPRVLEIALATDESLEVRRAAIICSYCLGPEDAAALMESLLSDPCEEIRLTAVTGSSAHSIPLTRLLSDALHDPAPPVRSEALRQICAYCEQEDKEAVFRLTDRILACEEEDETVRAFALEGLAHLMDERGLSRAVHYLASKSPALRAMAAYAVGHLGDSSHLPLLSSMLTDEGVFVGWSTVKDEAKDAILRIESDL